MRRPITAILVLFFLTAPAHAWFDETHLAVAKAAGYKKWYNAAAADVARVKLGKREGDNHHHNSPKGTVITPEMVLDQAERYDKMDPTGHLYGAIIASFRDCMEAKVRGEYAENHMAYLIHYIGDLSMPLHHILYSDFNRKYHLANDGIIDDEVLAHADKIEINEITIASEADLAKEVARIANLSKDLGYRLEAEDRLMTKEEAYRQVGRSASLLKSILAYTGRIKLR
ncbi:MAG: hypothetical protein C4519_27085 [Desulfobacteraceae bacterium]|nr:MAG: hypothetical protein C4519_27085 [Desulfobacteraceae bacterium]